MSDVPVQLIVAAFNDEKAADQALKELKKASKQKLIKIENAAVIRKDQKGKLHIKETADVGGGKGAAFGGVAGAAIGLIAGPALIVPAAVGALVGGLTAKLKDSGFSNERLETIGEGLKPGSSAIIAVVDHTWVAAVEKQLEEEGADLFAAQIGADIAGELEANHDVAYSALTSQEGYQLSRVSTGEDMVEGSELVVTDDEVYGGQYIATEEGFAVRTFDATEDGVLIEEMAATEDQAAYAAAVITEEGVVAAAVTAEVEEDEEVVEGESEEESAE